MLAAWSIMKGLKNVRTLLQDWFEEECYKISVGEYVVVSTVYGFYIGWYKFLYKKNGC